MVRRPRALTTQRAAFIYRNVNRGLAKPRRVLIVSLHPRSVSTAQSHSWATSPVQSLSHAASRGGRWIAITHNLPLDAWLHGDYRCLNREYSAPHGVESSRPQP